MAACWHRYGPPIRVRFGLGLRIMLRIRASFARTPRCAIRTFPIAQTAVTIRSVEFMTTLVMQGTDCPTCDILLHGTDGVVPSFATACHVLDRVALNASLLMIDLIEPSAVLCS